MTPPDAHQAPARARADKTEDWDARHAQSRAIEQQADGSFKAVDKAPPARARTRWAIDWRIEGTVFVEAATADEAQTIFDKRFGSPSFASHKDGEVSNDKPYEARS